MNSPYFGNGGGGVSFMPPPGLAQMLQQRDEQLQKDAKSIGSFAGSLGAGAIGAVGGAKNPGAFGPDTSATSGALQGGLMNFNKAYNGGGGGGGGGGATGFAGLTQSGGGGGSMNFKQFAAAGKAADGMFKFLQSKTPNVGDAKDASVYGVTAEQWDHLGTQDKLLWANSVQDKQANELASAKISEFAAVAQQRQQQAAQQTATQGAMTGFARDFSTGDTAPLADVVGPLSTAPMGQGKSGMTPGNLARMASAATPDGRFNYALNRNPEAINSPNFDNFAKLAEVSNGASADLTPRSFNVGGMSGVFSPKGGQFQLNPAIANEARLTAEKALIDYKQNLHQNMLDAGMKPAKDADGNSIEGVYIRPDGKSLDLRSGIEKQTGIKIGQPGASGKGKSVKYKLVNGDLQQVQE